MKQRKKTIVGKKHRRMYQVPKYIKRKERNPKECLLSP